MFTKKIIENAMEANDILKAEKTGSIPLCEKCHTPKFVRMEILGKERMLPIMCDCRKKEVAEQQRVDEALKFQEDVREIRKNSLMDERFANSTFKTVTMTEGNAKAVRIATAYCNDIDRMIKENQGLIFYGGVGTGKTLLAACIANNLIEKCYRVIMTSIVKILDSTGISSDDEAYIRKLNQADVLILDDLGAERKTDYAYERMYNIIDSRYRAKKPLIITTNMPLSQLMKRGDMKTDRIYDRVLEMCYPVEITGMSWRMLVAKERYDKAQKSILGGGLIWMKRSSGIK